MTEKNRQVAIITDDPGWHGRELCRALSDRGYSGHFVSLSDCLMTIGGDIEGISLSGFEQLPLGVFVRGVPGGTLEQVIFRMNILHALHDFGVTVFNTPRSIERTVDKPFTSLLLYRSGLPTPPTWICESQQHARAILNRETENGNRVVLKPLFGSQGIGVHLLNSEQGLIHDEKFAGMYYLQRYIERNNNEFTDMRIFVIDGVAVAGMLRRGSNWLTNRAQGAVCEALQINQQLSRLAEDACRIFDIDYAGVDVMQDKFGQFQIIEVNSIPAWYGLQQVADFNIADCLIDSFIKHISEDNKLSICSS